MIRSQLLRYGVAVLVVAQVIIIKLLLAPQIGRENPFLLLFTAVMVSAGYGGMGPGLLATGLAALVSNYSFLPPVGSFSLSLDEVFKMGVFVLEGLLVTSVIVALNSARERAESNALKAQRHQDALYKSEERYRLLVEGVKDHAIFLLDPSGQIVNWNAGAERIYGYQADEAIGQHFSVLYLKKDRVDNLPAYELKMASQKGYFEGTGQQMRKDGTVFWADEVITALKDQPGVLQGFSKVTRDVTERKQLEDALYQRAERLEQVNRIKDEFLATLSHELRTPLNSVLGWAQLLRTRKLGEDKIASGLETIERGAKSQVQLIEDLLDASNMVKGKLCLEVRSIDLVSVVKAAITTVRPAVAAKAINLRFLIADSGLGSNHEAEIVSFNGLLCNPTSNLQHPKLCIMGDPDRLQQVVWNLLSNAVKFTPEQGHVEVRLSVLDSQETVATASTPQQKLSVASSEPELTQASGGDVQVSQPSTQHSYAQIQISDTGEGISADLLPYIFNRFYQADSTSTRLHYGVGLGLAITRHLVELHGGTIYADSQGGGQGATFTINLPYSTARSSDIGVT